MAEKKTKKKESAKTLTNDTKQPYNVDKNQLQRNAEQIAKQDAQIRRK